MQHFIGCSGFHNKDWKEVFYPKGLPQKKWFEFYSTQFNTLELNVTFYRFPQLKVLEGWYERSPADFFFAIKVPRLITHFKKFNDTDRMLADFYTTARNGLKEKLGPVLFQLPAQSIYSEDLLERIMASVDESFINVVEFRHESWWKKNVYDRLAEKKIVFCSTSYPKLPDAVVANSPTIYYRYHGIPKLYYSEYGEDMIQKTARTIKKSPGISSAYIFFNNTATMAAINNARQLKRVIEP